MPWLSVFAGIRALLFRKGRRGEAAAGPRRRLRAGKARRGTPSQAHRLYRFAQVERRSSFAQEPIEVPAYEEGARAGRRAPHRFRWRGRWYLVAEVGAVWRDGRQPSREHPEHGRVYYVVLTPGGTCYQIYFERSNPKARHVRWMMYRVVAIRPGSGSTGAAPARS